MTGYDVIPGLTRDLVMAARYQIPACAGMTGYDVIPGLTRDLVMVAPYQIPACAGMTGYDVIPGLTRDLVMVALLPDSCLRGNDQGRERQCSDSYFDISGNIVDDY